MTKIGNFHISIYFKTLISFISFFLFSFSLSAQIQSSLERNIIYEDEILNLTLFAESEKTGGDLVIDKNLKDFNVVDESHSTKVNVTFANGSLKRKQIKSIVLSLSPKKAGNLLIEPIEVKWRGKTFKTKSFPVVVKKGKLPDEIARKRNEQKQKKANEQNNSFFGRNNSFNFNPFQNTPFFRQKTQKIEPFEGELAFELDKKTAYVGERVLGLLVAYTTAPLQSSQFSIVPHLKEFWREDLQLHRFSNSERLTRNGRTFARIPLTSIALFALKTGEFEIKPFEIVVEPAYSFKKRAYKLKSKTQKIVIKKLPVPQPKNFSGLVGNFQIERTLIQDEVTQNKPFVLELTVRGEGAVHSFDLPKFQLPEDIQVYDVKSKYNISKQGISSKTFKMYWLAKKDGDLEIPPLEVVVFNPTQNLYEEIKVDGLKIFVKQQEIKDQEKSLSFVETQKKNPENLILKLKPKIVKAWSLSTLVTLYSLVSLLILGTMFSLTRLRRKRKTTLTEGFEKQISKAQAKLKEGQVREASLEILRIVEKVMRYLGKDRRFSFTQRESFELKKQIEASSLKIQSLLKPEFENICKTWETLAFAPEDLETDLRNQNPKEYEALCIKTWKILEEACELKRKETGDEN